MFSRPDSKASLVDLLALFSKVNKVSNKNKICPN